MDSFRVCLSECAKNIAIVAICTDHQCISLLFFSLLYTYADADIGIVLVTRKSVIGTFFFLFNWYLRNFVDQKIVICHLYYSRRHIYCCLCCPMKTGIMNHVYTVGQLHTSPLVMISSTGEFCPFLLFFHQSTELWADIYIYGYLSSCRPR